MSSIPTLSGYLQLPFAGACFVGDWHLAFHLYHLLLLNTIMFPLLPFNSPIKVFSQSINAVQDKYCKISVML